MSISTETPTPVAPASASASQLLADRRGTGALPSSLHVLLDIAVADDCVRVRATLAALAEFQAATGVRVRLGTAGGPTSLGRLDLDRLERVATHLGAYARGFDGSAVQSHAITRTGPRHLRLARLLGSRPLAVLVTARPPADRVATARALSRSARAGLPWLVVTTEPGVDDAAFRTAVTAAPDAVSVAEVTDLRERPDTLFREILRAWDSAVGVEA